MRRHFALPATVLLAACSMRLLSAWPDVTSTISRSSPSVLQAYREIEVETVNTNGGLEDIGSALSIETTLRREERSTNMLHEGSSPIVFQKLLPSDTWKKFPQLEGFSPWYTIGSDVYADGPKRNGADREYMITKNGKPILDRSMYYGADDPVYDVHLVLQKPAFTFVDLFCHGGCEEVRQEQVHSNIFYDGQTFNEKYGVDESSYLFAYKGKFGFIGKMKGADYIFFNGRSISEPFSEIVTHSCCAGSVPFIDVYENGALLFVGSRGNNEQRRSFLVELDLNKYL
jgi:hypothetical protein